MNTTHPHPIITQMLEEQSKDLYNRTTQEMIDLYCVMLSGKDNKDYRQEIMEAIYKRKVPSKEATFTNLGYCLNWYFDNPNQSKEQEPKTEVVNIILPTAIKSPPGYQTDLFVQ